MTTLMFQNRDSKHVQRISSTPSSNNFRQEIQGLRGIAVLAVLIFHVSPALLPGGFLGVDVFLVLSGFLITSQLIALSSTSTFSFAKFYVRRFLRIYPSLLLTYTFFYPFLCILYPLKVLVSATDEVLCGLFGVSNSLYASLNGYFTETAATQPFLHTWSLSLELQFYLLWPLLLMPAMRRGRRMALIVTASAFCLSLTAACFVPNPSVTFFHILFRLFEFLCGGLLSFLLTFSRASVSGKSVHVSPAAEAFSILALASLVLSFFLMDSEMQNPGLMSLIPCLATVTIIYFGELTYAGKICSSETISILGKISYSVYLAHWPLIVLFMYEWEITELSARQAVLLVFISIVLGAINYRLVESNSRIKSLADSRVTRKGLLFCVGLVLVAASMLGAMRLNSSNMMRRKTGKQSELSHLSESMRQSYPPDVTRLRDYNSVSYFGVRNSSRTYLLIGDSFAGHLRGFAHLVGVKYGVQVVVNALFACPPVLHASGDRVHDTWRNPTGHWKKCDEVHELWMKEVATGKYDGVILAGRWTLFVEARREGQKLDKEYILFNSSYPRDEGRRRTYGSYRPSVDKKRVFFEKALRDTMRTVKESVDKVLLVSEPPDLGRVPYLCERWAGRQRYGSEVGHQPKVCVGYTREEMKRRFEYSENVLKQVAKEFKAWVLLSRGYFCDNTKADGKFCRVVVEDDVLYQDDHHMSEMGSVYLAKRWVEDEKRNAKLAQNGMFGAVGR